MSIELRDLVKAYGPARAIEGLSLSIAEGDGVVALIGPSGGGKSTLLRLLGGLEVPDGGSIHIDGVEIPRDEAGLLAHRRRHGFLFQSFNLFPHLTALENIVMPLVEAQGWSIEAARARANEIAGRFGMAEHLSKRPAELSGGQQQRIALGRAVAHDPALLLLDEPTSALDPERKAEVLDLVEELGRAGQRIVLSTHEMGFARDCADLVVFLDRGELIEAGPAGPFFENPRSETARAFLEKVMKW